MINSNTLKLRGPLCLPYAALVFCEERWLSLHEHVGWRCPLSEPSLPCEARLRSLPEAQAGTCPDGCASPAAAINMFLKKQNPLQSKIPPQRRLCWSKHVHMFTSIQAQEEFYVSLDELWTSRGADKTSSVLVSSPPNKLLIQTLAPYWTLTGSPWRAEPWGLFLSLYDNFHYGDAMILTHDDKYQMDNLLFIIKLFNLDMTYRN